jgi:hypothetical protein
MRHYGGLERTEARLSRLLAEFSFKSVAHTLAPLWKAPTVPATSPILATVTS